MKKRFIAYKTEKNIKILSIEYEKTRKYYFTMHIVSKWQ